MRIPSHTYRNPQKTQNPGNLFKDRLATKRLYQLHTWHVFSLTPKKSLLGSKNSAKTNKQHAHAAELLLPYLRDRPSGSGGARVLDVGAGSGYLTSVFYHLVFRDTQPQPQPQPQEVGGGEESARTNAVVVGIEHIPALTALAEKNIRADGLGKAIDERGIVLVTGDGRLGAFMFLPFLPCSGAKPEYFFF